MLDFKLQAFSFFGVCLFTPHIIFFPWNKRSTLLFLLHVHYDILDVGIKIEIAPFTNFKKKTPKQVQSLKWKEPESNQDQSLQKC
jgi:hypothetical protein